MGDAYQIDLVRSLVPSIRAPVLEIGSKRYGPPPKFFNYRTLMNRDIEYVGTDLADGDGVDVAMDMSGPFEDISAKLGGRTFNMLICMSVLEHVRDVFTCARNIERLMNPGALMVVSVPFAWGVHAYPDDYWRFTPGAIEFLFRNVKFDPALSQLHTIDGRVAKLSAMNGAYNDLAMETFPAEPHRNWLSRVWPWFVPEQGGRQKDGARFPRLRLTQVDMVGIRQAETSP